MEKQKKLLNQVHLDGVLVDKYFEDYTLPRNNTTALKGYLIVRTPDNSEHKLDFFINQFKKGTTTLTSKYSNLIDIKLKYRTEKEFPEDPTNVSIRFATLKSDMAVVNDEVRYYQKLVINFNTQIKELKNPEKAKQTAEFVITGEVEGMTDVLESGLPNGEKEVTIHHITERYNSETGENEPFNLEHFVITVPEEYGSVVETHWIPKSDNIILIEGDVISRPVVNVVTESTEGMIGKPRERTVTYTERKLLMTSGDTGLNSEQYGITPEIYSTLEAKYELSKTENKLSNSQSVNQSNIGTMSNGGNVFSSGGTNPTTGEDMIF